MFNSCTLENSGCKSGYLPYLIIKGHCKGASSLWCGCYCTLWKSRGAMSFFVKYSTTVWSVCLLLAFREVFNQGKVMCCDLRSVGDMRIYLRLLSSSPQILCIRPRLCSLHHCKALPSIHKYDEQQQLDDEVHLPSTLPSLEPFNASNSSIASKMQTRKIRWYVDTLKGEFELNYAYIMQTWALN